MEKHAIVGYRADVAFMAGHIQYSFTLAFALVNFAGVLIEVSGDPLQERQGVLAGCTPYRLPSIVKV